MFCPNCKSEYIDGVEWCQTCDVALVDQLAEDLVKSPPAPEFSLLLDLGRETRATETDALYLESVLTDSGARVMFYPWHPSQDVLTPLGATRPLQVLVDHEHIEDARALLDEVLAERTSSSAVVVPVEDAWVRRTYITIVLQHLRQRARESGGLWAALDFAVRLSIVVWLAAVLLVVFGSVLSGVSAVLPR